MLFKYILIIAFMGCICLPNARAADTPKLDPVVCQRLTKHTPDADVAYQAGVDVRGHYVAPADVAGEGQAALPSVIHIPLTLSLVKVLNLNPSQYPVAQLGTGTEAQLGALTVDGDKVTLNGQSLSGEQQDKLAVLCLKVDQ